MNIKSFFKKPIIASFLVVGALGMVVTTAYSTFYFANNFNISEQASPIGDAIRANQTFGEESDVVVVKDEEGDAVGVIVHVSGSTLSTVQAVVEAITKASDKDVCSGVLCRVSTVRIDGLTQEETSLNTSGVNHVHKQFKI